MTNAHNPLQQTEKSALKDSPALQTHTNIRGKDLLVQQLGGEYIRTRDTQMHHILILPTKTNSTTSVFCDMQQVFR